MRHPHPPPARRSGLRGRVAALAGCAAVVALAGCGPQPTALEKYCDVVHQAAATYDPLGRPGALGDPQVLRTTLTNRVTTLAALTAAAPEAVKADAALVQDRLTKVLNAMAAKDYVAASADSDPVVADVLADTSYLDATKRLAAFNSARCTPR